ncbi:MAG: hypothetical protein ABI476_01000 [Oxalobacteraceae bacterium]
MTVFHLRKKLHQSRFVFSNALPVITVPSLAGTIFVPAKGGKMRKRLQDKMITSPYQHTAGPHRAKPAMCTTTGSGNVDLT